MAAGAPPPASARFLSFRLEGNLYGVPLAIVERVVRVVALTPLPGAPAIVLGVFSLQGRIVPVAQTRARFGLPARDLLLTDHLIVAATGRRPIALLVDRVEEVLSPPPDEVVRTEAILPDLPLIDGVVRLQDDTMLIHDLDRFLSLEEERALDAACLAAGRGEDAP